MMPTGYTADVQSGKITSLTDYAMLCARSFGALITMRDDPLGAAIPEKLEPSDWHVKRLEEARARLSQLHAMTEPEIAAAAATAYEAAKTYWKESVEESAAQSRRYDGMLQKVAAWQVPEPLSGLKAFMADQIRESKKFDLYAPDQPNRSDYDPAIWFNAQHAKAQRDITYHTRENEAEIARTNERNDWLQALRAALSEAQP